MNPTLILIVLVMTLAFYLIALIKTHLSLAFYGAITVGLVGVSLIPLVVSPEKRSRKKR